MSKYEYPAKLARVIDGDTIVVDLDLGRGLVIHNDVIRLDGIDAPEVRGESREAGLASTEYLREMLDGREIKIESIKNRGGKAARGKYGRYLAIVWMAQIGPLDEGVLGAWTSANKCLVAAGHAVEREY